VGDSGTIIVTVDVRSWVTQTFTNTVRIFTSTPESDYTNTQDDEPTSVLPEADVAIAKTARTLMAPPGTEFDYTLDYENLGNIPAENVIISDTLPPELDYVSAVPSPITTGTLPLLRWSLGTLDVGETGTITLTVRVKADVTTDLITNTVHITTTTPEIDYTNNWSDAEVPTPVQLLYFWARPLVGSVLVEWGTAWEIDTYGFYLLRSDTGNLNDAVEVAFVPAAGRGQGGGATYSYLDMSASAGVSYTYWLADVDTDGRRTIHGPVDVPPLFSFELSALYQIDMYPRPYG
jgi:uncharacterized repeat protein (TIGR01451 family)